MFGFRKRRLARDNGLRAEGVLLVVEHWTRLHEKDPEALMNSAERLSRKTGDSVGEAASKLAIMHLIADGMTIGSGGELS